MNAAFHWSILCSTFFTENITFEQLQLSCEALGIFLYQANDALRNAPVVTVREFMSINASYSPKRLVLACRELACNASDLNPNIEDEAQRTFHTTTVLDGKMREFIIEHYLINAELNDAIYLAAAFGKAIKECTIMHNDKWEKYQTNQSHKKELDVWMELVARQVIYNSNEKVDPWATLRILQRRARGKTYNAGQTRPVFKADGVGDESELRKLLTRTKKRTAELTNANGLKLKDFLLKPFPKSKVPAYTREEIRQQEAAKRKTRENARSDELKHLTEYFVSTARTAWDAIQDFLSQKETHPRCKLTFLGKVTQNIEQKSSLTRLFGTNKDYGGSRLADQLRTELLVTDAQHNTLKKLCQHFGDVVSEAENVFLERPLNYNSLFFRHKLPAGTTARAAVTAQNSFNQSVEELITAAAADAAGGGGGPGSAAAGGGGGGPGSAAAASTVGPNNRSCRRIRSILSREQPPETRLHTSTRVKTEPQPGGGGGGGGE